MWCPKCNVDVPGSGKFHSACGGTKLLPAKVEAAPIQPAMAFQHTLNSARSRLGGAAPGAGSSASPGAKGIAKPPAPTPLVVPTEEPKDTAPIAPVESKTPISAGKEP